jgi:hypothetical protein
MFSTVAKAFNPATYQAWHADLVKSTAKHLRAGSINPFFKAMVLVGLTGYTMEYYMAGRKFCFNFFFLFQYYHLKA